MNCTFILANIINSKLDFFSSRFVVKVVLDGSPSTSFEGSSQLLKKLRKFSTGYLRL